MSVTIPIGGQPAAAANGTTGGVTIPFRFGLGTGASAQQEREQAVLRAVAAAVALTHTAESLTVADAAQDPADDPGARFAEVVKLEADLRIVVDEVVRVQKDRSAAPSTSEDQRVVAQAVGADPVLVAAAHSKLLGNAATGKAAREWVAVADAALLERAARAAARRELVGRPPATSTDLGKLEEKIDKGFQAAEKSLKEIDGKIYALDARLKAIEGKAK